MNTLYSLSPEYQQSVAATDYEVIVVENSSDDMCSEQAVASLGDNFHYHRREEAGVSPVPALNFAVDQCRGEILGLVLDGARMLTPRALYYALMAAAMVDDPVVTVPGYHLGETDQKDSHSSGHDELREQGQLEQLNWRENGYRLFQYACFSSGNKAGYLQPMLESSALFCRRDAYLAMGGAPTRFDQPGGGSVNLYIYRKMVMRASAQLFVMAGEGSFHQYHGGVTTSGKENRAALLKSFDLLLEELYGEPFKATAREPQLLGAVSHHAQAFLEQSLQKAWKRFAIQSKHGASYWDDERFDYWTEDVPSQDPELSSATIRLGGIADG